MESLIQREAERLGFAAWGSVALSPSRTFDRFQAWLDRGYAAGMDYLERRADLRSNPRLIAPEARSIIVVAARYPAAAKAMAGRPATVGLLPFSNYARGRDYHEVLRAKLKKLARSLQAECPFPLRARICVDSAPVLEREWAVRAGLGWIGRQGSLVNRQWGTTLFLGELLVNLELASTVSAPAANNCGDCRKCVEACPTGAIQADGLVDARACIAYLTIEHDGEIPEELQPLMGERLFGCDRCTAVCPYNPEGKAAIMPEFNPANGSLPTAEQCLEMSENDFARRFRGTAVFRSGLQRLQRNATIALANRRDCRTLTSG